MQALVTSHLGVAEWETGEAAAGGQGGVVTGAACTHMLEVCLDGEAAAGVQAGVVVTGAVCIHTLEVCLDGVAV